MEDLYFYAAVTATIFIFYKLFLSKKHNYPPGPRTLPIVGHLHLIKPPLYYYFEKVSKTLGPIVMFWMGKVPVLVISSPEAFEECFTKKDVVFADRPMSMSGEHLTFNYTFMVWAPHGPVWKSLRRLSFTEVFSPKALQKSSYIREQEVRHFLGRLYKIVAANSKAKVDMKHIFSLMTTSVIMRVAAGKRHVEVPDEDTKEEKRLLQQFKDLFFPVVSLTICDFIPILRTIGYKGIEKKMIKLAENREVFLKNLIREVRTKKAAGDANEDIGNSVINIILKLQESDPEFYTDDIVKGIVMMMFIAGTETSTATLEWGLTLLMQKPETMRKLQEEIDAVVGEERLMNEADFSKLPYLRAVVKETLRLYPPAPLLLPHSSTESTTVGGYEVPKGTMLMVNAWSMHRDPKHWDDPNSFIPERFVENDMDGHLYVPFGVGRRACPGAGMGTHIVTLGLGLIMQCFNWDQISMKEDMTHATATASLSKKIPLEATFSPRPHMLNFLKDL